MNGEQLVTMGRLMLSQSRFVDAERLLGQAVSERPNHAEAKALLAVVISMNRDRLMEATQLAEQAIADDPEDGLGFRALSMIQLKRNRPQAALETIEQAVALEPYNVTNFASKCECLVFLKQWPSALETAETGLQLDPENETCSSVRLLALERLGRVNDALAEGERLVRNSPDSAEAHASKGWALLNKGDYKESQVAFREALRLDPSSEFARMGMSEAIKSTNFLYRLLLKFSMALSRFSGKQQMFILLAIWGSMYVIPRIARAVPAFAPYATPLKLVFFVIVLGTWILPILANTLLRFHSFGKYLLSKRENIASIWMGGVLLIGLIWGVVGYLAHGEPLVILLAILFSLYQAIPLKLTIDANEGIASYLCYGIAIVFSFYFLGLMTIWFMGELGNALIVVVLPGYIFGILIYSFVGGMIANIQPKT